MDRRYQVFLSSTYKDLIEERSEAIQALLELDCMPSGMELFPAASDTQWKWIRQVIDESDYYIVILGGRYGTIHKERQISYTEMEYRYAIETGKPTLAFLHDDLTSLPVSKSETVQKNKKKLEDFRELCEQQLCKYWSNPQDLAAKISRSLTQLIRREPAVGWIKANQINHEQRDEIIQLKQENIELKEKLRNLLPSQNISDLSSGDEPFEINYCFEVKEVKLNKANRKYWHPAPEVWRKIRMTWDQILYSVAPILSAQPTDNDIGVVLNEIVFQFTEPDDLDLTNDMRMERAVIAKSSLVQIRMQFEALGLIEVDGDVNQYHWYPTELGERKIIELRALKKGQTSEKSVFNFAFCEADAVD